MKKSKIIVPALGLLLLSTAASVSGTVAWFTANRTYSASAGNFGVVSTKDNLACKLTAGIGTQVKTGDPTVIELANSAYRLTDASYDYANQKIVAPDDEGAKFGKIVPLASAVIGIAATTENGLFRETDVYTAFTWSMDFSLSFGTVNKNVALYFDASTSAVTAATGSTAADTAKGFRMAFVPTALASVTTGNVDQSGTGGVSRVWADLQTTANTKYISTADATVGTTTLTAKTTSYASPILMDSACVKPVPANGEYNASDTADQVNYLGTFTYVANTTVHLNYTVVVWFEGTDPTIVNTVETVYENVTTSLQFGVSNIATA